ncbi:N-acetylglucosamine-6-phosphate deacetylase [uncultured Enterococcus sp.]|uniref:N-acetylglucosamine-6-phosphate deacetylase n=1 Tax=uncultured Enterococcus sp. TaxID=167972 RepID=UPI002AA6D141|nr:N-acetylglucosamine-6-phosphate deacetylase [uncultured Enterococcus sp.]
MSDYFIYADRFFLKGGVETAGYLKVTDGCFGEFTKDRPLGEIVDYSGCWIAPGLVDTHIHGFMGHDVMDNDFDGIKEISKGLLSCGVTSFLPTTLTAGVETLNEVTASIGEHYQEVEGAKIRGIFFEGPFFTAEHKGAQNPDYFSDPDIEVFNHWQQLANGLIKKIALAPERPGATEFIEAVTKQGVAVALGHSAATYNQAKAAIHAGASIFVHTYNGMSGLNHREPGMVGAAMHTKEATAELICDGHHVHPAAAEILIRTKTPEKTALITDCMRAGGMPEGEYTLGEFPVEVKAGAARLTSNGSLAGSILQLFDGVKNVVDWDIATVEEAIKMASFVPAQSVGIDDCCGSIQSGLAADFLVIRPNMTLLETYLDGKAVYKNEEND